MRSHTPCAKGCCTSRDFLLSIHWRGQYTGRILSSPVGSVLVVFGVARESTFKKSKLPFVRTPVPLRMAATVLSSPYATLSTSTDSDKREIACALTGTPISSLLEGPQVRLHLALTPALFSLINDLLVGGKILRQEVFDSALFTDQEVQSPLNGVWALKRVSVPGAPYYSQWRIKTKTEESNDTITFRLETYPAELRKDLAQKFPRSVLGRWRTHRFYISEDLWLDSCSWLSGEEHVYNLLTVSPASADEGHWFLVCHSGGETTCGT